MAILRADDITWSPPPRCPVCGVGITAVGNEQPFGVDQAGRVYCRRHGEQADPTYLAEFSAYQERARSRVNGYLDAAPGDPLTIEELRNVDAELDR